MALQMMVAEPGGPRELAEDGAYKVRLASIEVKSEENPFKIDDFGNHPVEDKFLWTFETTDAINGQGQPFKFWRSTGTSYGNEKANLTILLDGLLGRHLSADEAADFDIQSLEGQTFNAMVSNEVSQKGVPFNKLLRVRCITPAGAKTGATARKPAMNTPAPPPAEEVDEGSVFDE